MLFLYAGVSLFDLWVTVSPLVHGVLFAILVGIFAGRTVYAIRALKGTEPPPPVKWGRYALLLPFLAVALYQAGDDWDRRLVVGFTPALLFPTPDMDVEARIVPPAYTRAPEVTLDLGDTPHLLRVPEGSRIIVRARDTRWPPSLNWDHAAEPLRPHEDGGFEITGEIRGDSSLAVMFGGHVLARWQVTAIRDKAPVVTLAAPVEATPRQAVRLAYTARDDHGVAYMALRLTPAGDDSAPPVLVDLPAYGTRTMEEVQYLDLTGHALAGRTVSAELVAVDGHGQEAQSRAFEVKLPKRRFTNATALSIMGAREALYQGEDGRRTAVRRLGGLTESAAFPADATVHLGLRFAYLRLRNAPDMETIDDMAELLWALALRAEDGTLSLTEIAVHDALRDALTLIKMGGGREAVKDAVETLALRFEAFGRARSSPIYINPGVRISREMRLRQTLDWVALRRFFGKLGLLVDHGAMAEVAEQLADLERGLEERPELLLSATAYRRYLVASHARRMVEELTREQRVLMSRAFAPAMESASGLVATRARTGLAGNQRALRDALVTLIEHLDNAGVPDLAAFYRARQAMDDAIRSLEARDGESGAASAQVQALTALDVASRVLATVPSPLLVDDQGRMKDPLGRPLPPVDGPGVDGDATPALDRMLPSLRP